MRTAHFLALLALFTRLENKASADVITLTVEGTVRHNSISAPPLDAVAVGDSAVMSFRGFSAFDCGGWIPECGAVCYEIIQPSFSLAFGEPAVSVALPDPFPPGETPLLYFYTCSIGHGTVEGFFLSTDTGGGVPISQAPLRITYEAGPNFNLWQDSPENVLLDIEISRTDIAVHADLDADCDVDLSDLTVLLAHFGAPGGMAYADGDLDSDGDVDLDDLATLLASFGATCP